MAVAIQHLVSVMLRSFCWLLVVLLPATSTLANALNVGVSDARLQACVQKLAQENGWTSADQVTDITCHNQGIASLDGLEQFVNVRTISLFRNNIARASIEGLHQLEHLNLARNGLRELQLKNLPALQEVYLFRNELQALQLNDLPALELLRINSNRLTQFTYRDLPALERIYLFDNQLEDVDIHNLPALKYMDARENPMPDELYDEMDRQQGVTILHDGIVDDW